MASDNPSTSIAVIGAGPGGLAAAMLLAGRGLSVTIYEAAPVVGGRTSRVSLGDFHFDRGPTFFLMPYVLEEVFAATGRRLRDYADLTRLDPMYRLVVGQREAAPITLDTTQGVAEMARRVGAIDARDGERFESFMHEHRRKLAAFTPVLRKGFSGLRDLLDTNLLKAGPWLNPHRSVHSLLGRTFRNPATRLALSFQSKYLGMSPYNCPSLFTILPFIEYEYGIWHPRGGCNALMQGMARACEEMGVVIRTDAPVEGIEFEGSRAVGVRVAGVVHRHEQVVINADAAWALKNLIPESLRQTAAGGAALGIHFGASPPYTDARLDKLKYSCSTFMLYLGLRTKLDLPHHTICVSSRYDENLADIGEGRLSDDPSFYICNPSRTDPTLAPAGCSSLYVLVPTPNCREGAGIDWREAVPHLRAAALARIRGLTGLDIEPHIACEQVTTPRDWQAGNIQFGATFNLAHGLDQMLHLRPRHEVPGMEGVWLVGGGTHPGSGLPVIFLSAQITARKLCAKLGVADPLIPRPAPAALPCEHALERLSEGFVEPTLTPAAQVPA
ncbi:MAG: phytoene desaturase family protein [Phycisphaerales bacterium]